MSEGDKKETVEEERGCRTGVSMRLNVQYVHMPVMIGIFLFLNKTQSCMSAEMFFFGVRGAGEGRRANRSVWLSGHCCSSSITDLYHIGSKRKGRDYQLFHHRFALVAVKKSAI